jgi:AraC-like DNA-binding protein
VIDENANSKYSKSGDLLTWDLLKQEIIFSKCFLRPRITIEEVASEFKVGRKVLSAYINNNEKVNFSAWINQLRIEEAKQLIISNKDITFFQVAENIGFTEQSNFSRQFKLVANVSPTLWRQSHV